MIKYKMFFKFLISILLFVAAIDLTFACNGYKLKVKKITNCAGDDAIITIDPDFSVKLTKKCELVPSGCVTNKDFTTAVAKYSVKKNGILLKQGSTDACDAVEDLNDESRELLRMFSIPEKCPVAEQKVCAENNKISVSKYKAMLSMARGAITVDLDVAHDTGKSCFHIEMEINK